MNFHVIHNPSAIAPVSLLGDDGMLKLMSAADYAKLDAQAVRLFCHQHARYGLPTTELIDWLRLQIADDLTIEIGAGAGDLSHHLGIRATDNRMQEWPEIVYYYKALRQPLIRYGDHVETLDALQAITKYRPKNVIAQWVTHKYDERSPELEGNEFGVDENAILATGVTYIFIGNAKTHGKKPILKLPHEEYALPFLKSRAVDPTLDRVWVWRPSESMKGGH